MKHKINKTTPKPTNKKIKSKKPLKITEMKFPL